MVAVGVTVAVALGVGLDPPPLLLQPAIRPRSKKPPMDKADRTKGRKFRFIYVA
jgi:hypothetical protein